MSDLLLIVAYSMVVIFAYGFINQLLLVDEWYMYIATAIVALVWPLTVVALVLADLIIFLYWLGTKAANATDELIEYVRLIRNK